MEIKEMTTTLRKFWTEVAKRRVAASQEFKCASCKDLLGPVWAADHIVPLRDGGTNALSNCQILCAECHGRKTQLETIVAADKAREKRTRTSKYWDPQSVYYMEPVRIDSPYFQRNAKKQNACR